MNKYDLVIVSCSGPKLHGTHKAKDLYTSQLFGAARDWALRHGRAWAIASAKYGVISPDKVIDHYDKELKTLADQHRFGVLSDCYLCQWARVQSKRQDRPFSDFRMAILAGKKYVDPILKWTGRRSIQFDTPLEGLQIGERLRFFREESQPKTLQPELF